MSKKQIILLQLTLIYGGNGHDFEQEAYVDFTSPSHEIFFRDNWKS